MVTYIMTGEITRLQVPEPQAPRFADNLWRHTCLELFVARRGEPAYYEFNFSPSGEWAAYAFSDYRQRLTLEPKPSLDPHVTVCRSEDKLELDAVVALDTLFNDASAPFALGLSAVIEDDRHALAYWALTHPLDKPDFHHRDTFALELDEIRH